MDVLALLEDLVRIESVNKSLGGSGEYKVAERVASELRHLGAKVSMLDVPDVGVNVVGVLEGDAEGPVLMLEAHLDTVPLPIGGQHVRRTEERLYGRGSCDTKASAASMLGAMHRLASTGTFPGTVIFAGVADEEAIMLGAKALLDLSPRPDGVVIGEPTSLRPVRAHNGFGRIRIVTHGRAAHTSKAHLGINAVSAAARLVRALEAELSPALADRAHPLAGPALLTASVIQGGAAPNIVPDRCEVVLDRRIAPGEDPQQAVADIDAVLDRLRADGDEITREEPFAMLPGVETSENDDIVAAAVAACRNVLGVQTAPEGVPYSTDACYLSGVGNIPSVVLGPGSIDQAHTDDEWVDLAEVDRGVHVYEELCRTFLGRLEKTS